MFFSHVNELSQIGISESSAMVGSSAMTPMMDWKQIGSSAMAPIASTAGVMSSDRVTARERDERRQVTSPFSEREKEVDLARQA